MFSAFLQEIKSFTKERCDELFLKLLGLFTLFHLFILLSSPVDLVSDEALYWEYSKHLDWSYYAKGPGIAVATWISTHIFGDTVFGVRVAALFCFTVFSAGMYYFLRSLLSPQTALFGFLITRLTLTFGVNGFVMTTDPLVLPFWLGSLVCASLALSEDKPKYWIPAFALAGLGVLGKFTAVLLLPGYGLVLLLSHERRKHLRSKEFWLASVVFVLCLLPIFIWNAQHEWVNIGHNVGHTVGKGGGIPFRKLPEFLLGQWGLVGPILFPLMIIAIFRGSKRWLLEKDSVSGLFVAVTVPLLLVCIKVTASRSCYANWPLPAYVGGLVLLMMEFHKSADTLWFRRGLLLNALAFFLLQTSWYMPAFFPASLELPVPIRRMTGWTELGGAVTSKVKELQSSGTSKEQPFVLALDYMTASSLRFSVAPEIPVRLGSFGGRRLSEQDYWQTWEELKGRDALVVGSSSFISDGKEGLPWFSSCQRIELPGAPSENRLAKPFSYLYCKKYNGKGPSISQAW